MNQENREYLGFLDRAENGEVSGWAMKKNSPDPVSVQISTDVKEFIVVADTYREKLKLKGIHPTGECGFNFKYDATLYGGVTSVRIVGNPHELQRSRKKGIFFMHIAKAAGTSINSYFKSQVGEDSSLIHIESNRNWIEKNIEALKKYDFLSGHVSYDEFVRYFGPGNYFLVTSLRKPIDHLISHLTWVRHLSEAENHHKFMKHPDYVQKISRKLSRTNFADVNALAKFIDNMDDYERMLFDNRQTRYFTKIANGANVERKDYEVATNCLRRFDVIGITEKYSESILSIARFFGWKFSPMSVTKENVSKHDYGFEKESDAFHDAVDPLIRYDRELYAYALEIFDERVGK